VQLIATLPEDYRDLRGADQWRGFAVPPGGLEPPEVLDMLVGWSDRLQAAQGWGTWVAVWRGEVVASLAVKDPLADGSVEIGYGVAPARRGLGVATAAVRALLPVLAGHGVRVVRAETAQDNPASGRVMRKVGFACVGSRVDPEDGVLDLWLCRLGEGGDILV
jgi:RimJ/RimL family protein N-acetyltransferase